MPGAIADYINPGGHAPDAVSALAGKLGRVAQDVSSDQHSLIEQHTGGKRIDALIYDLLGSIDADRVRAMPSTPCPSRK